VLPAVLRALNAASELAEAVRQQEGHGQGQGQGHGQGGLGQMERVRSWEAAHGIATDPDQDRGASHCSEEW